MTLITITGDIARQITGASFPIVLVDENGRRLGELTPIESEPIPDGLSSEEWSEIKRRMREPGEYITFQEVKERLGW